MLFYVPTLRPSVKVERRYDRPETRGLEARRGYPLTRERCECIRAGYAGGKFENGEVPIHDAVDSSFITSSECFEGSPV